MSQCGEGPGSSEQDLSKIVKDRVFWRSLVYMIPWVRSDQVAHSTHTHNDWTPKSGSISQLKWWLQPLSHLSTALLCTTNRFASEKILKTRQNTIALEGPIAYIICCSTYGIFLCLHTRSTCLKALKIVPTHRIWGMDVQKPKGSTSVLTHTPPIITLLT